MQIVIFLLNAGLFTRDIKKIEEPQLDQFPLCPLLLFIKISEISFSFLYFCFHKNSKVGRDFSHSKDKATKKD